jgi:uncharacterized protein (TIGR03437 family)
LRKLILAGLLAPLFLSGAEDRIPGRVDQGRLVPVPGHPASGARARFDRGPADPRLPLDAVTLLLKPDPSLDRFLADLQDPASSDYHRWLTPEQFASRFGLSQSDIAKITSWLASQGLRVTQVARGRHWITVSGTAERVGRAFHTEIHRFSDGQETHYANATDPSLPEALAGIVAGFSGLDDFGPKPQMVKPLYNRGGSHYLAPDDFATIYDLKPLYSQGYDGTGQSVAVIGQSAVDVTDIQAFRSQFGLPDNDPQMVLVGTDPGMRSGDMEEADLDLEWAGAVAPKARIVYVYSTSIGTSLLYAVDQNLAPVMTLSYGGCEQNYSPAWRYVAQQASAQGITWMVASGDQGAAACDFTAATPQASKGATVTWPAGIPEITAVGGTRFNDGGGVYWSSANTAGLGSALSYIPETAWNDSAERNDLASTGGGVSAWYPKPAWQRGPGVPADNARDVPDISFAASPDHAGYQFTSGGKTGTVGGTSVSSPAFAGIVAVLNQYLTSKNLLSQPGLGNLNPMLYRLAQASPEAFHDVTTGDNRVPCAQGSPDCRDGLVGYPAGAGYDLATGLGSLDVRVLAERWNNGTATTTTVSTDNPTPALDDTVVLTATVRGNGQPTGAVSFTTNYTSLGSADLAADGTATVNATAVQIAGGNGLVTAVYNGDGVFDGSSGDLKISPVLQGTGSVVVPAVTPNPVYQQPTSGGPAWYVTVTLKEMAGVATTLTGLSIDGTSYDSQIASFFKTANIPARGSIVAPLVVNELTPPDDVVFGFTGTDAGGQTWTRQTKVRFVGPAGPYLVPGILLTSTPETVQQNPQADPSCQWSHRLTVQEQSGFTVALTKLVIGGADASGRIQTIFGTTRLAPFGSLEGTVCWDSTQAASSKTYQLTGSSENGATVTASAAASLSPAAAAPAAFSTDHAAVAWQVADATKGATSTVDLNFSGGSPRWSVAVLPGNRTTTWLSVSPVSGSGPGAVTLQASAGGLSRGVYHATIAVQASDAVPQFIEIPVTLTVGPASNTSITGAANGASFAAVFAPGMLCSVFGTELAPSTQSASFLPLPLSLAGVSATVNGVTAPLYFVSPGQINLQIPYEAGAGPAVLGIDNNGKVTAFPIRIAAAAPGIFADSSRNLVPSASAYPGQIITMFITGDGDVTPTLATGATPLSKYPKPRLPLSVTVGGVPATLWFYGIPRGLSGVTQINFEVPQDAPPGPQPVVVTVGGAVGQSVTLNVTQ